MSSTPPLRSQGPLGASPRSFTASAGREDVQDDVDGLFAASGAVGAAANAAAEQFRPPMSFLRRVTSAPTANRSRESEHDKRKELERKELLEMILESIANVPKAVERIHTNEKLRQALHQEMGEENSLLHRFFDARLQLQHQEGLTLRDSLSEDNLRHWDLSRRALSEDEDDGDDSPLPARPATSLGIYDNYKHSQEDEDESEESSSDYGAEYENDLAEAVNHLCMTDEKLTAMDNMISDPIGIVHASFGDVSSARISSSPQSSFGLGASPGTTSMDGEPVSALWPRQPNQFVFTQEEDNNVRAEDEVYSEMVSSVCEDDSFQDDADGDEEDTAGDDQANRTEEKLFEMDDDDDNSGDDQGGENEVEQGDALENGVTHFDTEDGDEDELGNGLTHFNHEGTLSSAFTVGSPVEGQVTTFQHDLDGKSKQKADTVHTVDIKEGDDTEDNDNGSDVSEGSHEDDDGEPKDYEVFQLRIIREKNRTGFEPNRDWRPRPGTMIGDRYKVRNAV
ncbi:unnamed protein product [Phytophthora lilii]|uniref:Unnamed protein product n=1 Tax=Phytophthora lilii TaxID=2077276 RepID=A0A9W6TLI8_9STRA|nr:unnamed protein product [Phytophthora lilii]